MNQAPADRRDPKADHLLTPENAALVLIDYQAETVAAITSVDHDVLMMNAVALAKTAKAYELPTVLTTVAAKSKNTPTYPELREIFPELEAIDRSTMNPWEDNAFRAAVEATGRRKLIMGGLWTEICLAFPTLDAMREGFEVYPVIDAVGGTTDEAHQYAVERMIQAARSPSPGSRCWPSCSVTGQARTPMTCARSSPGTTASSVAYASATRASTPRCERAGIGPRLRRDTARPPTLGRARPGRDPDGPHRPCS